MLNGIFVTGSYFLKKRKEKKRKNHLHEEASRTDLVKPWLSQR